jgi:hypothetical protein
LQLADVLAPLDVARSDGLAEAVLAVAPETDMAYERLIQNARRARDLNALGRLVRRYEKAAVQHGFPINPHLTDEQGGSAGARALR